MLANRPLSKYRVLDLASERGAFCGRLLADFGADVLKIERPGGDALRNTGPFLGNDPDPEKSIPWFFLNAGKRGVTLDIESSDGQQILKRLTQRAHFIVESFPANYLEGLGMGYSTFRDTNPGIIMVSITPFGQSGPRSSWKDSDLMYMALGGFMNITGEPGQAPMRISVDQAYLQGGSQAAAAAMIAHYFRQRTGIGQHVDVSVHEAIVSIIQGAAVGWEMGKRVGQRSGRRFNRVNVAPLNIWPCKDGYIAWKIWTAQLGTKTKAVVNWMRSEGFGEGLEEVDWEKLDYTTLNQDQMEAWESQFAPFFLNHTKAELYEGALKWGPSLFPINAVEDLTNDEQLRERQFWTQVPHPELGQSFAYPGEAIKSSAYQCGVRSRSPLLGEHNIEIYEKELGLSKSRLDELHEAGVI